ncbi:ribose-5-phosphate isomerase RpiA [Anaerocolumna sp. MB42-C2]|uniref:ribose-5-phosphate isomerase RpiA n=1 Tax=Anaerocolumna sp. MB42-C2 TaxID=3070997 RepID=UPI0027E02591|nr:ribose-5-phosphate isomerase RpiA [Anaerocolumna sp. MB42-C2]WMJ85255.1 ribose-5-phosphate isomerase RpiA [Anaerocolumna sp. MB42-C2]
MNDKKAAGEKAAEYVKDGMVIGLGTGSTVYYTICKIGSMVRDGLKIKAVSTSQATNDIAVKLGIPMVDLNCIDYIDITIDGADEVDTSLNGIKGGGGALLLEKIVATYSKYNIWVIDSNKYVSKLGRFPVPVEVIPNSYMHLSRLFEKNDMNPILRMKNGEVFTTDSGNYILDLNMKYIEKVHELNSWLNNITGVVEHGLFINIVDKVIIAKNEEINILTR